MPALGMPTKTIVVYVMQMNSMIVLPILLNFNRVRILSVSMPCRQIYPSAQYSPAWVIMRNILLLKVLEYLINLEIGMEAFNKLKPIEDIG